MSVDGLVLSQLQVGWVLLYPGHAKHHAAKPHPPTEDQTFIFLREKTAGLGERHSRRRAMEGRVYERQPLVLPQLCTRKLAAHLQTGLFPKYARVHGETATVDLEKPPAQGPAGPGGTGAPSSERTPGPQGRHQQEASPQAATLAEEAA